MVTFSRYFLIENQSIDLYNYMALNIRFEKYNDMFRFFFYHYQQSNNVSFSMMHDCVHICCDF